MKILVAGGIALAMSMSGIAAAQLNINIGPADLGTPFNPGVRGQAIPAITETRTGATNANPAALTLSVGSSIRGVAGGLEAEDYDWETSNYDTRFTTLDYLRYARDYDANLIITTNMRGLTDVDNSPGAAAGSRKYTDESIATVTRLAADWVRYTNVIAQKYNQASVITDPTDLAVMNSLVWNSSNPARPHDKLPATGEAPLPKVEYWEIGNEPRVSLKSSFKVTNSYTFLTDDYGSQATDSTHKDDYAARYASMTAAMKAVDPTIKVGPCLQSATSKSESELLNSILDKQSSGQYLPVDFISYHPYQKLDTTQPVSTIESYLQGIYAAQKKYVDNFHSLISASGRDPNSIQLISSETNVSDWTVNDTLGEAQMAHALGSVETVFSFARLGLSAANYWLWPSNPDDNTRYPVYKAYAGLRDHMGDTLLNVYSTGNTRVYTTRSSNSGQVDVWGLNFSNSDSAAVTLALTGLASKGYDAKLMTLESLSGPTTLFSANLSTAMGGPTHDVDWVTTNLPANTNFANYNFNLPAATMSVLVLDPLPEPGATGMMMLAASIVLLKYRARQIVKVSV